MYTSTTIVFSSLLPHNTFSNEFCLIHLILSFKIYGQTIYLRYVCYFNTHCTSLYPNPDSGVLVLFEFQFVCVNLCVSFKMYLNVCVHNTPILCFLYMESPFCCLFCLNKRCYNFGTLCCQIENVYMMDFFFFFL